MGTSDKTLIQYYSRDLHRNTVEIQDVSFTTGMPFAALLSAQPHTNPTPASLSITSGYYEPVLHFHNFVSQKYYIKEITQFITFRDFFFRTLNIIWRFITVRVNSVVLLIPQYPMICIRYSLLNHSPSDGHLVCFQFGGVSNKAAMNIRV